MTNGYDIDNTNIRDGDDDDNTNKTTKTRKKITIIKLTRIGLEKENNIKASITATHNER